MSWKTLAWTRNFAFQEQLLRKYKYPCETHFATTKDGYILRLHRIANPGKKPMLLQHGLLDSSATWIIMGPDIGIGYKLYENGYDVWMGNVRGNRYSRNHTTINPAKKEFWTFSWHEMGVHDIPTMINYILNETKFKSLSYMGHSQGTTTFFVFGSTFPEELNKVDSMHALAPVAFMKNLKNPLLGLMKSLIRVSGSLITEFLPHNTLLYKNCFTNSITLKACIESFYMLMGKNDKLIDDSHYPLIFGHTPAGSNLKQWKHYIQLTQQDRFGQFDYGPIENQKIYGQPSPPDYNLSCIDIPVELYYAFNDNLSSPEDVRRLSKVLQNARLIPFRQGNHMTMMWSKIVNDEVLNPVVQFLKKLEVDPSPPSTKYLIMQTLIQLAETLQKQEFI